MPIRRPRSPRRPACDHGPYIVGVCLLLIWFAFNYTAILGVAPITGRAMNPQVPPELVGRILGYIDSACLMFLAWVFGTTRSSSNKDETINRLTDRPKGP